MTNTYIKKYWPEEDILFYLHFEDKYAVRQIEIGPKGTKFLDFENPTERKLIYDQSLDDLELNPQDYIDKLEFDKVWEKRS